MMDNTQVRYTIADLTSQEVFEIGAGRYKAPKKLSRLFLGVFVVCGAAAAGLIMAGRDNDLLAGLAIIPVAGALALVLYGWTVPSRRFAKSFLSQAQQTPEAKDG